jgi:hypothetical protein
MTHMCACAQAKRRAVCSYGSRRFRLVSPTAECDAVALQAEEAINAASTP